MPRRTISPRHELPGKVEEIDDGDRKFTLFLPSKMRPGAEAVLTIHFHSAQWHAIQEHVDRGLEGPLIAFYPGEGSSIYGKSFESPERLTRWIRIVTDHLAKSGWPPDVRIAALDISSFSAGFGAVRQLVQQPEAFKLMRRVVLADSLYGSLRPGSEGSLERTPEDAHLSVWRPLAEAAMRGEKSFAITYSEVPTPTYASSSEMARALVARVGGMLSRVDPEENDAAKDPEFPLKERFDRGRFHVWGYGGSDGQAHMTHARHLADIWKSLDAVKAP